MYTIQIKSCADGQIMHTVIVDGVDSVHDAERIANNVFSAEFDVNGFDYVML